MGGDCWLMAALACLAEFPDQVKKIFEGISELSPNGQYTVQLYDHNQQRMRDLCIDEFIPCYPRHWWDDAALPLFSKPTGKEAWVLLLEKAMAKLFGSYGELNGGNPATAFRALTGEQNTFVWMKKNGNTGQKTEWQKGVLQSNGRFLCKDSSADTSEDVFLSLAAHDRDSYLAAASIDSEKTTKEHSIKTGVSEHKRQDGLVSGHAYSLLQVIDVTVTDCCASVIPGATAQNGMETGVTKIKSGMNIQRCVKGSKCMLKMMDCSGCHGAISNHVSLLSASVGARCALASRKRTTNRLACRVSSRKQSLPKRLAPQNQILSAEIVSNTHQLNNHGTILHQISTLPG